MFRNLLCHRKHRPQRNGTVASTDMRHTMQQRTQPLCGDVMFASHVDVEMLRRYQGDDNGLADDWREWIFDMPTFHRLAFEGNLSEIKLQLKHACPVSWTIIKGPKYLRDSKENKPMNFAVFFIGTSPLMMAARSGHKDVVEHLLSRGMERQVDRQDSVGLTALAMAITFNHKSTARPLLKHGAGIDSVDNLNGLSPLLRACKQKSPLAEWLLHHGASTEITDKDNRTCLHYAAWNCTVSMVELLLSKGKDPNTVDIHGNTALHYALGEPGIQDDSIANTSLPFCESTSTAHYPADMDDCACEWRCLVTLLKHNTDPNIVNKAGFTPLHTLAHQIPPMSVTNGHVRPSSKSRMNELLLVQMLILIQYGADPDTIDPDGRNLINICRHRNNYLAIDVIRSYGVHIQKCNPQTTGPDWKRKSYWHTMATHRTNFHDWQKGDSSKSMNTFKSYSSVEHIRYALHNIADSLLESPNEHQMSKKQLLPTVFKRQRVVPYE